MNLKTVKERVRSVLGDQDGDWTIDSYLLPMINHVYGLELLYLRDAGALNITNVRVCANIDAGKSDLTEYQRTPLQPNDNRPLYGLLQPYKYGIEWKQAGSPDWFYRPLTLVEQLPDFNITAAYPVRQACFEWRAFGLYITAFTYPIDLRVRGDFNPYPLMKDTDEVMVHPNLGEVLVEDTAACAMRERANQGQMSSYQLVGTRMLDQVVNLLVRSTQGLRGRTGRMSGRRGGRGNGGTGSN